MSTAFIACGPVGGGAAVTSSRSSSSRPASSPVARHGRSLPGGEIRDAPRDERTYGLRHGYAELDTVRLHYVEAGRGSAGRAAARLPGVLVRLAPPDRIAGGGGLSGRGTRHARLWRLSRKPAGVAAYAPALLAGDVRDLIAERGGGDGGALLAGHDWGAAIAWATAAYHPQAMRRLAILNMPHPRRMLEGLRTSRQLRKSWYMGFFQLPWICRSGC